MKLPKEIQKKIDKKTSFPRRKERFINSSIEAFNEQFSSVMITPIEPVIIVIFQRVSPQPAGSKGEVLIKSATLEMAYNNKNTTIPKR